MRKVETIRAELEAAQERLTALESAGLLVPEAEAVAKIDEFIGQCADRARAYIAKAAPAFCNRTGWRPRFIDNDTPNAHSALERMQDITALLAPDVLRSELQTAVHALYQDGAQTMDEAARQRAVEDLRVKISKLEREEFAACTALGLPIRAGTPAALVLGLET